MKKVNDLAVLIECSGGSTPTADTLKNYIRLLSEMGYNQLYLGCTDAFKIENEPYFNYKRGGYDTASLRELDAYAAEHGIELIASIQTLAHLHYLKKYNVYTPLFDTDNVLMVGDARVYELIDHMFAAISSGIRSRRIHIGFDEAFGIGTGRYLSRNGYRPKRELMAQHLREVVKIAAKYGYSCEIWGDMFTEEKEGEKYIPADVRDAIPEGVRLVLWDYNERDREKLRKILAEGKRACDKLSYAGSAYKICGFAPSNGYSISRIVPQLDACRAGGADQYILTLWADGGGLCSVYAVLPAVFAAAEYAAGNWDGTGMPDTEKFFRIAGVRYETMFSLDYLNDPFRKDLTTLNSRSYWILYSDILLGNYDSYLSDGTGKAYEKLSQFYRRQQAGSFSYLFETASDLARLLSVKAELGLCVRGAYAKGEKQRLRELSEKEFPALTRALKKFEKSFERQWLTENFCFGLEVAQLFLGGQMLRYRYVKDRIDSYVRDDKKIGELEGAWLPPCIIPPIDEDACLEMNYRNLISYCGI